MRYFRFLVLGNAISAYGSYLNMLALNLFAYELTGSVLFSGLFLAVRLVAGFLTGFVAGRVAQHRRRKPLMIAGELSQAIAMLVLVLSPAAAQQEVLYAVAVVTGVGSTISQVTVRSLIPELVGQDLRTSANGLLVTGRSTAMVLGFASAGAVGWVGYHAAFLTDAVTFVVSAVVLWLLPIAVRPPEDRSVQSADGPDGGAESFLAAHRAALRFLWTVPVLLPMIAIRGIDGLGSSSHNVALPVYSSLLDPEHPAAFMSRFWVLWAIGNIVFQQLLSRYTKKTGRAFEENAFALGTCLMSGAFILAFAGLPLVATAVVALVAGAADGFTEVSYVSRLQTVTDEQRGHVFGLSATVENFGVGVGMLLTSAALEFASPLHVVAAAHGTAIVMALLFLARQRRSTAVVPRPSPSALSSRSDEVR